MSVRCIRQVVICAGFFAATVGASSAAANTFTVTSTADSGPGTLRQAILDANGNLGTDTIEFDIAGAGPHTIAPTTALPALSGIVVIDGLTQDGASCPGTWPPTLQIILNGANAPGSAHGLFSTGNSTIRGLVINGWGMDGIHIENGDNNIVQSCFIGTNAAGTAAVANGRVGVSISETSVSNQIGVASVVGATACQGNLISGNGRSGIVMTTDGNRVAGNYIGTDVTGLVDLGNANDGVNLTDATCGRIGTNGDGIVDALERNIISGNNDAGIRLVTAQAYIIAGNYIGVGADGTTAVGNGNATNDHGIDLMPGSRNNRIGTDACDPNPLEANIIANHEGEGIAMNGTGAVTFRNSMLMNSIYNNDGLGICFIPNSGVTLNDAMDIDTGANLRQNFPIITSANGFTITGTLNSVPLTQFRLEFFANTVADPSGHGEGEVFLTAVNVTTDAAGDAAFAVPYTAVAGKPFITSTATSLGASTAPPCTPSHDNPCSLQVTNPVPALELYNTSEFSGAVGEQFDCELSCEDIEVNNEPGVCAADVDFGEIATEECLGLGFVLTCTIDDGMGGTTPVSSGSSFPVGTTLVTCQLFAPTGALVDECTFNVTVLDAEDPEIMCPADIAQATTDPAVCSEEVSFTIVVSDNCDTDPLPQVVCTIPDGMGVTEITSPHVFPVGTTTVTCTATDAAGNSEECTFDVTVRDGQPPTVVCPPNITVDRTGEQCGEIVSYIATASDSCGIASFVCTPPSGSLFPVGATTVTCTATDLAGLSASCSFTVTVEDDDAEVEIVCPANITTGTDDGECGATITFDPEVLADCDPNRGLYLVTCTIDGVPVTSPHLFPVGTTTVECCVTLPAVVGGGEPGVLDCCEFTVTVTDDEDPVLICRQEFEVYAGQCGTVILGDSDVVQSFTDNCPIDCCDPKLLGEGEEGPFELCGIVIEPSVLECPALNTPIQIAVTGTDCHGNTATCIATVIVRGEDCNNNGFNDACDICNGAADCDENGVLDECECFWCNVREPFGAIPVPEVNAQLSHLGGGTPCGEKVADDFYLEPGCAHRITAVRGRMLTNSHPALRRARVEFYEDCNGKPVDEPFLTFDYEQDDPIPSEVVHVQPALDGFSLVTYRFDLCDECIWLDGGKTYWVSLIGLTDHIDHVDLSYWVAGDEHLPMLGNIPVKRSGTPGSTWGSCDFGAWESIEDCCIGCVNMDFCVDGYSCPIIWDNGDVDLVDRGGSASGAHRQYNDRTADSFVVNTCREEEICLIEAWIWTNCPEPICGFIELYEDLGCDPRLANEPFRRYECGQVDSKRFDETVVISGRTFNLWRLRVKEPDITLAAAHNYWVSAGAISAGNFNANSFFAWSKYGCDPCNGVESYRITPGMHRTLRPPPTEWADVVPARDFAFTIAAKPLEILPPDEEEIPFGTPACLADANSDGTVEVDDIFTFLAAWFTGCP